MPLQRLDQSQCLAILPNLHSHRLLISSLLAVEFGRFAVNEHDEKYQDSGHCFPYGLSPQFHGPLQATEEEWPARGAHCQWEGGAGRTRCSRVSKAARVG